MKELEETLRQALGEWQAVDKSEISFVPPYEHAHPDVIPVPEANIATDLGPKLLPPEELKRKPVLKKGSRLCVVGYDGSAVAEPDYVWRKTYLSGLLEKGCDVDYYLNHVGPGVLQAFRDLKREVPGESGVLRLFVPKGGAAEASRSEITAWETFHFAVSEKPETLWIETNHPANGKPQAYGCFFFPETAARATGLAKQYLDVFDRIKDTQCEQLAL